MIVLKAIVHIEGENQKPAIVGESRLGERLIGSYVYRDNIINSRRMTELSCEITDRDNNEDVSWGIVSNGGSVSFNDSLKFFRYKENGIPIKGAPLVVFLENTLSKTSSKVGEYTVSSFSYDSDNKVATLSFNDGLEELQNKTFEGFSINPKNFHLISMEQVYEDFAEISNSRANLTFVPFEELDEDTKNHIRRFNIPYYIVSPQSIWSVWKKFAEATQTRIHKRKDGKVTCKYIGGR